MYWEDIDWSLITPNGSLTIKVRKSKTRFHYAEVGPVFFRHRLGSPLAALVRHAAVVENAIEADAQVIVCAYPPFFDHGSAFLRWNLPCPSSVL